MTPKIKGKIVLVGAHTKVAVNVKPPALRRDDEQLRQQLDPERGARRRPRRPRRGAGRGGRGDQPARAAGSDAPDAAGRQHRGQRA